MQSFPIPRTLEEAVHPERMALLVYDMQVGIVRQIADGARVVAQVERALAAARGAGMRVFFTRHMSLPLELMGASQYCGAGHPEAAARSISSLRFAGDTLFSDVETFGRLLAAHTPSRAR